MAASNRNPQYYCPLRDKFINLGEADVLVVSAEAKGDLPKPGESLAEANITVRRAYDEESEEVTEVCHYFWDENEFYCFDQTFDVFQCVNILAIAHDEIAGLLSYKKTNDTLLIIAVNVYPEFQGQGIARRLIRETIEQGRKQGCKTIRVATTNDDVPALAIYQKMGFRLKEIVPGVIAEHHGEELPGFAGIPVLDEIRLEREV